VLEELRRRDGSDIAVIVGERSRTATSHACASRRRAVFGLSSTLESIVEGIGGFSRGPLPEPARDQRDTHGSARRRGCLVTTTMTITEAVATLRPTDHVVLPPGCGEAVAFERELGEQAERLAGWPSTAAFCSATTDSSPAGVTATEPGMSWSLCAPRSRPASRVLPDRGSQIVGLFDGAPSARRRGGACQRPDRHGYCSFGVSASYPIEVARLAGA